MWAQGQVESEPVAISLLCTSTARRPGGLPASLRSSEGLALPRPSRALLTLLVCPPSTMLVLLSHLVTLESPDPSQDAQSGGNGDLCLPSSQCPFCWGKLPISPLGNYPSSAPRPWNVAEWIRLVLGTLARRLRVNSRLKLEVFGKEAPFFWRYHGVYRGWDPGRSCQDHHVEGTCLGVNQYRRKGEKTTPAILPLNPTVPEVDILTFQFPS